MKNNILTITKKECARIIGDRRLFFSAVVMPGLLIFVVYTLMGTFFANMFHVDEEYVYDVHAVNLPDSIGAVLRAPGLRLNIIPTAEADVPGIRAQIENQQTDLLIVFPPGFDNIIFDPDAAPPMPNVQIWSNSARSESAEARHIVQGIIANFHHELTHRFTINAPAPDAPDGVFDLITDADAFAMIIGMVVPMMTLIFIFSASQALAPESIAGEKERGTLAGMLVTPASRRDIAIGKIISIALFCMLSAAGSIVGMMLSMPNMLGFDSGYGITAFFEWYSISDVVFLFMIAASTSLVFVSLLSLFSAYAKSVKESTTYAMPIMIVCIFAGFASTIFGQIPTQFYYFLVPVINSSLIISSIFSFEVSAANALVATGANILFAVLAAFFLAKMFSSEKIVFDK